MMTRKAKDSAGGGEGKGFAARHPEQRHFVANTPVQRKKVEYGGVGIYAECYRMTKSNQLYCPDMGFKHSETF